MMMNIRLLAAAALFATAAPAMAAVTVGSGTSGNCFPFGCVISGQPSTVYQQVYAATAFPGAITVTGLQFTFSSGSGDVNAGTYTIALSTTAAGINTINTSDFAANLGADNRVVFTGALPAISGGLLTLNLASPFTYNPLGGNLLLDVRLAAGVSAAGGFTFFTADTGSSTVFSRATNFGSQSVGWGLNTIFITGAAVVPEPASWAMLIAGFGLVGAAARRRRAVAA